MVFLRVDCHYPGTSLEPTSVVVAPVGLGLTPLAVHTAFLELLRHEDQFELPAHGSAEAILFCSETVHRVVTWETAALALGTEM